MKGKCKNEDEEDMEDAEQDERYVQHILYLHVALKGLFV